MSLGIQHQDRRTVAPRQDGDLAIVRGDRVTGEAG
jgi:hypothetical protein